MKTFLVFVLVAPPNQEGLVSKGCQLLESWQPFELVNFEFMTIANIIWELDRLPLTDKLFVIERALKSIRIEKEKSLKTAVDNLYDDYSTNGKLTFFAKLDKEPFYELY